jgi:uncharacterized protein (TIGR00730 family)
MSKIHNVCVYCGASPGTDPRFLDAADVLGTALAAAGIGLVFGGGDTGMMGRVARATLAAGGRVTGVIPTFLMRAENALLDAQELVVVEDMHARKQTMFERADAFVALPGGIGTLEELAEQLTWAQLQRHRKPVLIADIAGFWRPLIGLLTHMRQLGFLRDSADVRYIVAERAEDIVPMLQSAARHATLGDNKTGGHPAA